MNDLELWEHIKKTTKPLNKEKVVKSFPKYVPIKYKEPLPYVLDLHGYTIQEAYDRLKEFVEEHYLNHTKYITVITGKGTPEKESFIHYEIETWLETEVFKKFIQKVEWLNGNGAIKFFIKSKKVLDIYFYLCIIWVLLIFK